MKFDSVEAQGKKLFFQINFLDNFSSAHNGTHPGPRGSLAGAEWFQGFVSAPPGGPPSLSRPMSADKTDQNKSSIVYLPIGKAVCCIYLSATEREISRRVGRLRRRGTRGRSAGYLRAHPRGWNFPLFFFCVLQVSWLNSESFT